MKNQTIKNKSKQETINELRSYVSNKNWVSKKSLNNYKLKCAKDVITDVINFLDEVMIIDDNVTPKMIIMDKIYSSANGMNILTGDTFGGSNDEEEQLGINDEINQFIGTELMNILDIIKSNNILYRKALTLEIF